MKKQARNASSEYPSDKIRSHKSRKGRSRNASRGMEFEVLEDRQALAVTALAWGDTLYVEGDAQNNGISIQLSNNGSQLLVKEYQSGQYNTIYQVASNSVDHIYVHGFDGADTITVGDNVTQSALLMGGAGNDYIKGGGGTNTLYGHDQAGTNASGDEILLAGPGVSTLWGQGGNDTLFAGPTFTWAYGGHGNDTLWGSATGWTTLDGGSGNDTFYAKFGTTAFHGGGGTDTLSYESWVGPVTIRVNGQYESGYTDGAKAHKVSTDLEIFKTGFGNDHFFGSNGAEKFYGNRGNDYAEGGGGNDQLWGGDGVDLLKGGAGNDLIVGGASIDTLWGGDGNDTILGGDGNDKLWGGDGNDTMYGDAGDDQLLGQWGTDTLWGGSGSGGVSNIWWAGFDGIHATLELDGVNSTDVSHRYLWGQFGDDLLADEVVTTTSSAGTIQWALSDQVDTVRDIGKWDSTNSEFVIANHRVYNSFGKLESESNGSVNLAFGFTGKWTDEETGYTHHLNRIAKSNRQSFRFQ